MIEIKIQKELIGSKRNIDLDIDIKIKEHDFIALSGQSGSGKTTILRILAGLEKAKGLIKVGDKIWQDDKIYLEPQQREIGFVFQDYALFENMSILENLLFVKKDKKLASYLLSITELENLKNHNVKMLSGGQKQRVSLCRALMNKPKLLLMDEPLSALDETMRIKLQNEILRFHKEFDITTIMVSHDPSEIYKLSNQVFVLENGKIIKNGNAKDVLLKTSGSTKFSFEGEILDIIKIDVIYMLIIAIGQQIVEIVLSENETKNLKIGTKIQVSTKAFSPIIS